MPVFLTFLNRRLAFDSRVYDYVVASGITSIGVARGNQGAMPPQIFRISSEFVL